MKQADVELFLARHYEKMPPERLFEIRERLFRLNPARKKELLALRWLDPLVFRLVSILFGMVGLDRVLAGDWKRGALKGITLGGLGLWYVYDWIAIAFVVQKKNYGRLDRFLRKVS